MKTLGCEAKNTQSSLFRRRGNPNVTYLDAMSYHFDGGYITFYPMLVPAPFFPSVMITNYVPSYHYYLRDHQGRSAPCDASRLKNNRVVVSHDGTVEQTNDYYAYGGPWGNTSTNQGFQPFKYNGKELDRVHGLDWYDYGARRYDPAFCQFTQMDPLCEQYPHLSPYAYCAGNPVNAIDPDGKLIVFINGFHNGFQGASPSYWSKGFNSAIMSHFCDYHTKYLDGSLGGIFGLNKYLALSNLNPVIRYNAGMKQGKSDAEPLISGLKRDNNGIIIENIRLVSHSMGGAYAKGYAQALVNYIKNHPQSTSGLSITEYDFAPFEPTMQKAVLGVDTYQYSHKHDRVAGSKKIEGAHYMKTSESIKDGHSISSFWQYIYNLPEGHYIFENGIPNNDN